MASTNIVRKLEKANSALERVKMTGQQSPIVRAVEAELEVARSLLKSSPRDAVVSIEFAEATMCLNFRDVLS